MTVVADSGPLIALAKIEALGVLSETYGKVLIPTAVYEEVALASRARSRRDALTIRAAIRRGHVDVVEVADVQLPPDIRVAGIDRGEKQAIYLAVRERAGLMLVDDATARQEARRRGLSVHGTLGVIMDAAKAKALTISEAEFFVQAIQARNDIWIADIHCRRVLEYLRTI